MQPATHPRRRIDLYVLRVKRQGARLDRISHVAIEHSYAANFRMKRNTNRTNRIVGVGGYFARAPRSVPIRIDHVVPRHRIVVVIVNIVARFRIL